MIIFLNWILKPFHNRFINLLKKKIKRSDKTYQERNKEYMEIPTCEVDNDRTQGKRYSKKYGWEE